MISTKGRYALRVMIDLAEQNSAGYIPLNEIATRQQISEKYLEIILKVLVKNKLLEGQRGKGGGHQAQCHGQRQHQGQNLFQILHWVVPPFWLFCTQK